MADRVSVQLMEQAISNILSRRHGVEIKATAVRTKESLKRDEEEAQHEKTDATDCA